MRHSVTRHPRWLQVFESQHRQTQVDQPRAQISKLLGLVSVDTSFHGPDIDLHRQIISNMRQPDISSIEVITYGFKYLTFAASNLTYSHMRMKNVVKNTVSDLQFEDEMKMNKKRVEDINNILDSLTSLNPNALPREIARLKGLINQFGSNIGVMDVTIARIRENLTDEAEFASHHVRASLKVINRVHHEAEQRATSTSADAPSLPYDPSAVLNIVLPERETSKLDRAMMPYHQSSDSFDPPLASSNLARYTKQETIEHQGAASLPGVRAAMIPSAGQSSLQLRRTSANLGGFVPLNNTEWQTTAPMPYAGSDMGPSSSQSTMQSYRTPSNLGGGLMSPTSQSSTQHALQLSEQHPEDFMEYLSRTASAATNLSHQEQSYIMSQDDMDQGGMFVEDPLELEEADDASVQGEDDRTSTRKRGMQTNQTIVKRRRSDAVPPPSSDPLPRRSALSRAPASYNETQLQRANRHY
jgi:hypothetical protein